MQYTDIQISAIRMFGRKELNTLCIIKYGDSYVRYLHPGKSFHIVRDLNGDTFAIGNEDLKKIEILGHPVEWHDVFAYFQNEKYMSCTYLDTDGLHIYPLDPHGKVFIPCNPCLSPMSQPLLLEELLKLIK